MSAVEEERVADAGISGAEAAGAGAGCGGCAGVEPGGCEDAGAEAVGDENGGAGCAGGGTDAGAVGLGAASVGLGAEAVGGGAARTAAVFFVGNRLMLDEGVGPAAYDAIVEGYEVPPEVRLFDVGCMSMDMLPYVESCDVILTVDAVDGTGDAPGTVYRFPPDAMARHCGAMASLHDLRLVDLFDAASLLGYEAEGYCLGMQVDNMAPEEYVVGLTPAVHAALPLLVETVVAELARRGFSLCKRP